MNVQSYGKVIRPKELADIKFVWLCDFVQSQTT
jgi:hypothetical protein